MIRSAFLLLCCLLLLVPSGVSATQHELKIFVLHSYHQEYSWTREVHRGFIDTLQEGLPDTSLTVATESLDSKRLPYTSSHAQAFFAYLRDRYADWQPDLIFVSDDNALSFMRQYGEQLFPGVTVNFCGVNRLELRDELHPPAWQGVFEIVPVAENLHLAKRFDSDLDEVLFIGDGSETHHAMERRIDEVMPRFASIKYQVLGGKGLAELIAFLHQKKHGTLILTTIGGLVDAQGKTLPLARSIAAMAMSGNFRIYCMEENNLLPGVLGGELNSGRAHGEFVARQVLNQRRDTLPAEVIADRSPTLPMFDCRQLQRFDIAREILPAGAIILHEPRGFYHRYFNLVWGTLAFIAAQAIIILWLVRSVRRRKAAEQSLVEQKERLRHLAHHDVLTGLPNRMLCADRLQHALSQAKRNYERVALLFLDLDRFKKYNDSLGHEQGDRLLCQVADRLMGCARQSDTVARLGGDEFIIIMENIRESDMAARMANKILNALKQPLFIEGHEIIATSSIGIGLYPDDAEEPGALMTCADVAMYRAKELGGDSFQFHRPEMSVYVTKRLELEAELRKAIELEQLELYYQPQAELDSGRIVAMEALVRWIHPQKGVILPAEFIPLAEETGLIIPLGDWALKEACRQNALWQGQGLLRVPVAVNISARQFEQGDLVLVSSIREALQSSGLDSRYLRLEITESTLMSSHLDARRVLRILSDMGIHVAIDDFGSGYASLSYLKHFPLSSLKVDRDFLLDLEQDPRDGALVNAIIALAEGLGLEVVAEGIEREGQRLSLIARGCRLGQGFLHSRPVMAEVMQKLLCPEGGATVYPRQCLSVHEGSSSA